MGLFGFGSKEKNVVDLAERYRQQKEREAAQAEAGKTGMGEETAEFKDSDTPEERRRKLAKRLVDIVTRLEDISTKLYHLQQRVEVLERKIDLKTE